MDCTLGGVAILVTHVDRAKESYKSLGWRLHADLVTDPGVVTA
jgi:hypothetical protein